jgi:hypothetical protein
MVRKVGLPSLFSGGEQRLSMPFASLPYSPLLAGRSPVEIYYRDEGEGAPLVLLHGGRN